MNIVTLPETIQPEVNIIDAIYQMLSSGYVATVAKHRMSYIEMNKLVLDKTETHVPDPSLQELYETAWVRFGSAVGYHLTAIGIVPFRLVKKTVKLSTGAMRSTKIPVALEGGTFKVRTYIDDQGEKQYQVTLKGVLGEQPDIHVLRSMYRNGPSVFRDVVDSDCGLIVHEWLDLETRKLNVVRIQKRIERPVLYLQQQVGKSTIQSVEENQELRRLEMRKVGKTGYDEEFIGPMVIYSKDENTGSVPAGYEIAAHAPTINPVLLDISYYQKLFFELTDVTFNMPIQSIKSDSGTMHSRSQSAIDETKANKLAAINEFIGDITIVLQGAFEMIYDKKKVTVTIPTRSLVDMNTLFMLNNRKILDLNVMSEEASKLTGIHLNRIQHSGTSGIRIKGEGAYYQDPQYKGTNKRARDSIIKKGGDFGDVAGAEEV